MEIEQEVNTVSTTDSLDLNSPTFQTRKLASNVAVRSNQAVVLGGLIQDRREEDNRGIPPGLYSLPIIGPMVSDKGKEGEAGKGDTQRQGDHGELP